MTRTGRSGSPVARPVVTRVEAETPYPEGIQAAGRGGAAAQASVTWLPPGGDAGAVAGVNSVGRPAPPTRPQAEPLAVPAEPEPGEFGRLPVRGPKGCARLRRLDIH